MKHQLIKNVMALGLLSAIGIFAGAEASQAQQRVPACYLRDGRPCPPPQPGIPDCYLRSGLPCPPPQPGGPHLEIDPPVVAPLPPEGPRPWPRPWPPRPRPDVEFNFSFGNVLPQGANRCSAIAQRLEMQGFRRVRAVDCEGRTYIYRAWRGGQRVVVYVSPMSGRIRQIVPAY